MKKNWWQARIGGELFPYIRQVIVLIVMPSYKILKEQNNSLICPYLEAIRC